MTDLIEHSTAIAEILKARGDTVAVAETSAGGLISAQLLAVGGASAYFMGGGVLYTGNARETLAGITNADMANMRSSSEPFAELLADTLRRRLASTWGLAETGAAGPTGNRYGDDAGHTCVAVSGPVSGVVTLQTGNEDRGANMWRFSAEALKLFMRCLQEA
ncbi:MAG: damage-inducible protein [Alphaproteobacteria bacterium]|nr:damage-inducible protein [Alphaproteobacteria bacterium]HCP00349.1 damage-inducible protein [Rhodospirillaceae bacterium]